MLPFAPPNPNELPQTLPELPTPLEPSDWPLENVYARSKHIVPACYIRVSPEVQLPSPPPENKSKEERRALVNDGVNTLFQMRINYDMSGSKTEQPKILWLCLNRYVKRNIDARRQGVTLFCLHANGIVKEVSVCQ